MQVINGDFCFTHNIFVYTLLCNDNWNTSICIKNLVNNVCSISLEKRKVNHYVPSTYPMSGTTTKTRLRLTEPSSQKRSVPEKKQGKSVSNHFFLWVEKVATALKRYFYLVGTKKTAVSPQSSRRTSKGVL